MYESTQGGTALEVALAPTLPQFVRDRVEHLQAAGLVVTRSLVKDDCSTLWLEGTRERIEASGLPRIARRKKWPVKRRADFFYAFNPIYPSGAPVTVHPLDDGRYRLVIANETLPTSERCVGTEITRYEWSDDWTGRTIAHLGQLEQLIEVGIAPEEARTEDYDVVDAKCMYHQRIRTWAIDRLDDGRVRFLEYPDAVARHALLVEKSKRVDHKSVADFRAYLETMGRFIGGAATMVTVTAKDGTVYRLREDSQTEVEMAVVRLRTALAEAVCVIERPSEPEPVGQEAVDEARADGALQAFLRSTAACTARGRA